MSDRPAQEEVLLTWAELAYYRQCGPCPYLGHRSSDWLNDAGRWVCGICHPPLMPVPELMVEEFLELLDEQAP